ncbi:MAG: hypothetical protein WCI05_00175 [Myxococcales bacterium]
MARARSLARFGLLGLAGALTLAGGLVFRSPPALAKASYDSPYGFERTWNASLRFVRVDSGWKITERDESSGYLLFEYRSAESGNRTSPGSLEIVRAREPDAPVRVVVQLPQMPRYHEQALIDGLVSKMRAEYGDPPARRRPEKPSPQPQPDAGVDGAP